MNAALARLVTSMWAMDHDHFAVSVRDAIGRKMPDGVKCEGRPTMDLFGMPIEQMRVDGGVAIVPIKGALVQHASPIDQLFGDASYQNIVADLRAADSSADTLLLDINSPGGMVIGMEEVASVVEEIASRKMVCAVTDSLMCSAAYRIASAASMIYATPSSMVGSVGAIKTVMTMRRHLEAMGVDVSVFASGKYKAVGNPMIDMEPEHEMEMQRSVDETGDEFRSYVATKRPQVLLSAMEGQAFSGRVSRDNGLIDDIVPSVSSVLDSLKQIA